MTTPVTTIEPREGEDDRDFSIRRIRELIKEAGFFDFREMVRAWHVHEDWSVYGYFMRINAHLEALDYPTIPDCCIGVDHNRGGERPLYPGELHQAPNWPAAKKSAATKPLAKKPEPEPEEEPAEEGGGADRESLAADNLRLYGRLKEVERERDELRERLAAEASLPDRAGSVIWITKLRGQSGPVGALAILDPDGDWITSQGTYILGYEADIILEWGAVDLSGDAL